MKLVRGNLKRNARITERNRVRERMTRKETGSWETQKEGWERWCDVCDGG